MKIHFIGIGGIGISGLAQYMHFKGHTVSGSDISDTIITKKLRTLGIKVTVPHSKNAIDSQDLVVHSAIISPENPEIILDNHGIVVMKSEQLGGLVQVAELDIHSMARKSTELCAALDAIEKAILAEARSTGKIE